MRGGGGERPWGHLLGDASPGCWAPDWMGILQAVWLFIIQALLLVCHTPALPTIYLQGAPLLPPHSPMGCVDRPVVNGPLIFCCAGRPPERLPHDLRQQAGECHGAYAAPCIPMHPLASPCIPMHPHDSPPCVPMLHVTPCSSIRSCVSTCGPYPWLRPPYPCQHSIVPPSPHPEAAVDILTTVMRSRIWHPGTDSHATRALMSHDMSFSLRCHTRFPSFPHSVSTVRTSRWP